MSELVWNNLKITLESESGERIRYLLDGTKITTEPYQDENDPRTKYLLKIYGQLRSYEVVPTPNAPVSVEPPAEPPHRGPEEGCSAMYELFEKYKGCTNCELHKARKQVVFGAGNDIAPKMLVIGEAPGPEEERQGIPFIGPTGSKLRQALMNLRVNVDEEVYITNSVICFPRVGPDDKFRGPTSQEILACRPRLEEQFSHLLSTNALKGVLLVGKRAYLDFFHRQQMEEGLLPEEKIESFRFKEHLGWYKGDLPWEGVRVMAVYHPSYLMRQRLLETSPEFVAWRQDIEAFVAWCTQGNFYNPRV